MGDLDSDFYLTNSSEDNMSEAIFWKQRGDIKYLY